MMKKTLSALLALLMLFSLGACSFGENDAEKGKDNASETLDTVKEDVKDQTETQASENDELISDEEAIALCIAGQETVHSWGECAVIYDYNSEGKIIREFDDGVSEFTPLKKDDYSILQSPDIRGNTKIYYGDYEWMQENLKKIYTDRFIEKHFNGFPWPFIYENGTVYFSEYAGGCSGYQTDINYTVINKTENEFSVVYETYHKDYDTREILYSEDSYLGYMKFVKEGDLWLIDAYNSTEIIVFIYANDVIPAEFKDKVPEKYRDKSYYFEEEPQASEDEELISDEEAIELFELGEYTSRSWLEYRAAGYSEPDDPKEIDYILREYADSNLYMYYAIEKTAGTVLSDPDLRGNDIIYYGDHEWMQENLRKVFTEKYIEKYFSYGYPSPLIYEDGVVYNLPYAQSSTEIKDYRNYTVIHKTKDELAVICEAYGWDYITNKWDYSEIDGLAYMKFVKIDGEWLIDEHYSAKTSLVTPKDLIPAEYMENVPEKYKNMTMYFEGYTGDSDEVTEIDIMEFINLERKYDEESGRYYLTKDEILAFDKQAEFRGYFSYPTTTSDSFHFYIRSLNCSLFGYNGYIDYYGYLKDGSSNENVISMPSEMYGTRYEYVGDGSDVLFEDKMVFTIPNVTYNDFVDILEKINVGSASNYLEGGGWLLKTIKGTYGADTVTGNIPYDMPVLSLSISDPGGNVHVYFEGKHTLDSMQRYAHNANPLTEPMYNKVVLHITR